MNFKLFFVSLVLIILVAGCVEDRPVVTQANDNVLVLSDYKTSHDDPDKKLRPGGKAWIEFWLTSQAEEGVDIKDIKVRLFNPVGFWITSVACGDKRDKAPEVRKLQDEYGNENGCYFNKIESHDSKKVRLELRAPDSISDRKLSLSVKYDYSNTCVLSFSVLASGEEEAPVKSPPTDIIGPVHVDIGVTMGDWITEHESFTMSLNTENWVDDNANLGSDFIYPIITIPEDKFKVTLTKVYPEEDCKPDFEVDDNILTPVENVEIPTEYPLTCDLVADGVDEHWVLGMIEVDYSYTYEFIKTQTFNVVEK